MGRNKTTGGSHNKKASTYKSKRIFKSQNKNKQPTLFKFLKYSRDVDNNEDSRQKEMEPCEEFPTEGTEEPIYNSSDSEVNSSSDEDLDVDVNEEETSKDEIDREVSNPIFRLIKLREVGIKVSVCNIFGKKKRMALQVLC